MTEKQENLHLEKRVYSGMILGNLEGREKIRQKDSKAYEVLYNSWGRKDEVKQAKKLYDEIADLDGILDVVERRDPTQDSDYRCGEYVFKTVKNESWMSNIDDYENEQTQNKLYGETRKFLKEKGYQIVQGVPQAGDVIGYTRPFTYRNGEEDDTFRHFGIYTGKDIISKFGRSHIYRHEIDAVPFNDKEVTTAVFFRKQSPNQV